MHKTNSNSETDLLIGIRPLLEALEAGREVDKIYLQRDLQGQLFKELWQEIKSRKLPYAVVPKARLDKFTRRVHQGVVAQVRLVPNHPFEEVIQKAYEKGQYPFLLVLDRVSDVRNLGAMARTAEAAGMHGLVIGIKHAAALNQDAMKTSAGALQHLPVCREANLNEALEKMRQMGLCLVGMSEKADLPLWEASFTGPLALVMGAEDLGIAPERQKLCHQLVRLPMSGQVGSLNVSVAAGIAIYEALRQRL